MLPARLRLNRAQTTLVVARGRPAGGKALGLRFLPAPGEPSCFAIVVPSKKVSLATRRQLVKRRIRAIIRKLAPRLCPGRSVVVFCGRETAEWSFAKLEQELTTLFQQTNLLS